MKERNALLCVVFAFAVGFLLPVSAQSTYHGQDWAEWSETEKTMYIVGWVDGRADAAWKVIGALDPKLRAKGKAALDDPRLAEFQRSVTVGQMYVGMGKFYEDYKNLNITVRTALALVNEQLKGGRVTEEKLQRIRQIEAESAAKRGNEDK